MSANDYLITRPLRSNDATKLHELMTHPAVAEMMLKTPSMELSEMVEWVEKQQPGRHRLVVEKDGTVIGMGHITQAQNPRCAHSANLVMMIHPDYWGQGAGTAVLTALLNIADNWLDLKRVELGVYTHNTAAIHLYQKFGFENEGMRRMVAFGAGKWQDDHLMARLRNTDALQPRTSPPPLRPPRKDVQNTAVTIRPFKAEDLTDIHRLFTHPAVGRTTMQLPSTEFGRIKERIEPRRPGLHRLMALVDNRVAGNITVWQRDNPRIKHIGYLGMMVDPRYWGMGIGSRLMEAILDIADNWLNLKRVELEVNTDNPIAVHLYEKFGFVIEGTKRFHAYGDGRWSDSHFMARIRS